MTILQYKPFNACAQLISIARGADSLKKGARGPSVRLITRRTPRLGYRLLRSTRKSGAPFLVLFILACSAGGETLTTSGNHTGTVTSIDQKLGIKLPKGTEVLGVETEAGIDDAIRAKLRVPASSGAEFLGDCPVKRFRQGGANLLGPDHGFWDPHRATMLRSGEVTLQSGRALLVAIDESSSDAIIVFAMNYST